MAFSLLGRTAGDLYLQILKGRPDFISVFTSMHTSIMHRFRNNQVFLFAGNDFMTFSPLEGAIGNLYLQTLKGDPDFIFTFH